MFRTLLKPAFKKMGKRYDYDVDYMLDMKHFDCGPCLRLVCNMAREAGVNEETIVQGLTNPQQLPEELQRVVQYSQAVVSQDDATLTELAPALTKDWGAGGVAEISLGIAFGGFYPTLKRGLGAASTCEPVLRELQQLTEQTGAIA